MGAFTATTAGAAGGDIAKLRDQLKEAKADARKAQREARRAGNRAANRGQRIKTAKEAIGGGPGQLDGRLSALAEILGGDGDITKRATDLRNASENAVAIAQENEELKRQLAAKDEQLAAKDEQLAAKDEQLAAKDQQLANKEQQVADKDQEIADLNQEVADRDQQISDLNEGITDAENALGGAGGLVARATSLGNQLDPSAATANAAASNVGALLGGTGSLSSQVVTLQNMIGGSGTLAERVGEPATGTTGMAALIRNDADAVNPNGFDVTGFNSATTLSGQQIAFLAALNQDPGGSGDTTFTVPKGGYGSLREVLSALDHQP